MFPSRGATAVSACLALLLLAALAPQAHATPMQGPDLHATGLWLSPAHPTAGDNVTVSFSLRNEGQQASPSFIVQIMLDTATLRLMAMPPLGAGATMTVSTLVWSAIGGNHTFGLAVDPNNHVDELDEGNNNQWLAVHVNGTSAPAPPGLPNLRAELLRAEPAVPSAMATTTLYFFVTNTGATTDKEVRIGLSSDGGKSFGDLAAIQGAQRGAALEGFMDIMYTSPGPMHLILRADYAGTLAESNETDNTAWLNFTVQPRQETTTSQGPTSAATASATTSSDASWTGGGGGGGGTPAVSATSAPPTWSATSTPSGPGQAVLALGSVNGFTIRPGENRTITLTVVGLDGWSHNVRHVVVDAGNLTVTPLGNPIPTLGPGETRTIAYRIAASASGTGATRIQLQAVWDGGASPVEDATIVIVSNSALTAPGAGLVALLVVVGAAASIRRRLP